MKRSAYREPRPKAADRVCALGRSLPFAAGLLVVIATGFARSGLDGVEPLRLKWRFETRGRVWSSPAVGPDGTVYIGSMDGWLYALEGAGSLAGTAWPKYRHDNLNTGRFGGGTGATERPRVPAIPVRAGSSIIRGSLFLPRDTGIPALLDISGRKVMDLQPGENDIRLLAPGVYFVRAEGTQVVARLGVSRGQGYAGGCAPRRFEGATVRRVVITR